MNIGYFTKNSDGTLTGSLPTLGFDSVTFEPITKKGNGPNFEVLVNTAELGAAWNKTAGKTGRAYLSARLVIPGRPAFDIAVFETEKAGRHVVVYSEPRQQEADAEA